MRGITQIPVNEKKGLTFARGLRSILRHDPDKIMVGEIRDQETAQIAIQSALTGHSVFTTVHANNVTDVIGRFINMGVEPYNFVSALNCILAQRLVRVICESCKKPVHYAPEQLKELRTGSRRMGRSRALRRRRMPGMQRHRLSRPDGNLRADGFDRSHPRNDYRAAADFRNQARWKRRGNGLLARVGPLKSARGSHDDSGNQQGDFH